MTQNRECASFSEEITAMVMGELSPPEKERLESHTRECSSCRRAFEETAQLIALTKDLPKLEGSPAYHDTLMDALEIEQEALRLCMTDRVSIALGCVGYQLKHSKTARFLLIAAAAMILVFITIMVSYDLPVQTTRTTDPFAAIRSDQGENPYPPGSAEEESWILTNEEGVEYIDPSRWKFDPPSFKVDTPSLVYLDKEEPIPLERLDRKIEWENRLELSRYRMYGRLSQRLKKEVSEGKGGDPRTAGAVQRGLAWLKRCQRGDGSWNPDGLHGGDLQATVGISALSVAAFLSDGHTEQRGRYARTVRSGIAYLLSTQDEQGYFGGSKGSLEHILFNQSTAVFVLVENYILSEGEHEDSLVRGVECLMSLVSPLEEGEDDQEALSARNPLLDAWAALALKTATLTGIVIPDLNERATAAEEMVALMAREEHWPPLAISTCPPPLYAASEGALDVLFHEESIELPPETDELPLPNVNRSDSLFALLEDPDYREPSFLFFIGTALCEEGNPFWKTWNTRVKDILLHEQTRDGLWPAGGDWPWIDGGDLYTTSLHLLTLQVYYRYIKLGENCQ